MVYWLRLRLHLLPSIAQEIDQVSNQYMALVEDSRRGDKASYNKLLLLQNSIKARLEEFDQFYDNNYSDYRIPYFQKQKLRLRKLLSTPIELGSFIDSNNNNHATGFLDTFQKNVKDTTTINTNNNNNTQIPTKNQKYIRNDSSIQKSPITSRTNTNYNNNNNKSIPKKEIPKDIKKTPEKQIKPSTARPIVPQKQYKQNIATPQKSAKKDKDEVVFTIRMTKDDYQKYLGK